MIARVLSAAQTGLRAEYSDDRGTFFVFDVVVVGGGAAGMMCALTAGQRGRRVALLEHNDRVGRKIAISGGGRCNFTNLHAGPDNFLSKIPTSADRRWRATRLGLHRPRGKHGIAYHEKKLGQQFCNGSSREIIAMLLDECRAAKSGDPLSAAK